MKATFDRFASLVSDAAGSAWASSLAVAVIILWGICGPIFGFSDTWQLVINTGTTIITFLMVFLIQHAQNRDTRALHVKLDEIIHAIPQARNEIARAEDMAEEEIMAALEEYQRRHPNEED
jgi:low affinity Fe/Cu permease